MNNSKRMVSHSPEETWDVARTLLPTLHPGSVLALHGDLGAGKTCFVQGLARALGVERAVNSPTFTLINEYPGPLPLYHIDLYRIAGAAEALALGLDDYLHNNGITAIEWAERAAVVLPRHTIHILFETGDDPEERIITLNSEQRTANPEHVS